MVYDRRRVGLYGVGRTVVLSFLLLIVTSTSTYAFTLQTAMISARKSFVSLSSPESDEREDKVIREPSVTISLSNDVKSSGNNIEDVSNNQFNFNGGSLISNIGIIAITLLIASLCLSLIGNVGGAFATELLREVSNLFSILINIIVAIGTAVFGMLKFILPVLGKGVADGVVAATTPIVKDAAYSASQSETSTSQSAADAVISSTAPLFDTFGQAVDTSIVNPIQEAAGSVSTAINRALPELPKVPTPELPTLPTLPSMPDVDPTITIGGVTWCDDILD